MGEGAAILEEEQLQAPWRLAAQTPQHQGVEAHLEQRLGLEARSWGTARLVIHDAHGSVGGDIETIHEAAQHQAVLGLGLDEELPFGRLQACGILHLEVGVDERLGLAQPRGHLVETLEQVHDSGVLIPMGFPPGRQDGMSRLPSALVRGQVVQALQDAVDKSALMRGQRTRIGDPVDCAQAEHERALHEVLGARWRQCRPASSSGAAGIGTRIGVGSGTGDPARARRDRLH